MAEDWQAVAAEVAQAIAEVGFAATLEEPGAMTGTDADPTYGPPSLFPVTVIDSMIRKRDGNGMVTQTVRQLMMAATVAPAKGWRVEVRGKWHRIAEVMPLAPGGVDLMFKCELEA